VRRRALRYSTWMATTDGYPEILGPCRDAGIGDTKGRWYTRAISSEPHGRVTITRSRAFTFPFGNLGLQER